MYKPLPMDSSKTHTQKFCIWDTDMYRALGGQNHG